MSTTVLILFALIFITIVTARVIINDNGLFCRLFDLILGIVVILAVFVGIGRILFALLKF